MKRTKLVTSVVLLVALAGCGSNADTASDNIAKDAEKFKVGRRIVVTNSITDKVEFSVEGRCSFEVLARRLDVVCKDAPKRFTKATIGLGDNTTWALVAAAGYVATIFAANWLIAHVGVVSVGFGLVAPAGVFAAGVALTLRDVVQARSAGSRSSPRSWRRAALLHGEPRVRCRERHGVSRVGARGLRGVHAARARSWLGAVALSNTVGLVIDSALFLWLAFGSLEFFWGQVVGKAWMTLLRCLRDPRMRPASGYRCPHGVVAVLSCTLGALCGPLVARLGVT
jgi:hypothetical protein